MIKAEINRLWLKLYPHRRAAYAKEFAALRAGTSVGEMDRKRKQRSQERVAQARDGRRRAVRSA